MATDTKQEEKKQESKLREVKVSLTDEQEAIIVNSDTLPLIAALYMIQDEYDNESKFLRRFVHESVVNGVKAACTRIAQEWTRMVDKHSAMHPTWTREACEKDLLSSKKKSEFYAKVKQAIVLKSTL